MIKSVLWWTVTTLIKALFNEAMNKAIRDAIDEAERSGLKGEGKARVALDYVREHGGDAARQAAETELRLALEAQLAKRLGGGR